MSIEKLELLRQPFPANQISKLPKPYKKDSPKGKCHECGGFHGLPAVHLDYVGHAALTDRLLDVDPAWSWEPVAFSANGLPQFDESGGLWIRLTVCGVSRLGYGHAENKGYMDIGAREKEVIGDALRNAAMRFGAALDLWHKGDLHASSEEPETLPAPVLALRSQLNAAGIPEARFCKAANIESLADFSLENLNMAQEWITKVVAKNKPMREPGADESEDVSK
jgi:hypothetical protein